LGIEYVPYSDLPPNVIDALQRGKKIEAIKHYRNATGVGLKEAKEVIEDVQRVAGI
jgi:ribosomal protein L7/L12